MTPNDLVNVIKLINLCIRIHKIKFFFLNNSKIYNNKSLHHNFLFENKKSMENN